MDNGADRYLHKKFKKQLSIEPRTNKQQHHNNNHTPLIIQQTNNNTINDNNRVPTTNHDNNSTNSVVVNYVKSSISRGDNDLVFSEQKSSTDISYPSERIHFIKHDDILNLNSKQRTFNNYNLRACNPNHVYNNTNSNAAYHSNQNERLLEMYFPNRNDRDPDVLNLNANKSGALNLNQNEQLAFGDVYNNVNQNQEYAFDLKQNDVKKEASVVNLNQNESVRNDETRVSSLNQFGRDNDANLNQKERVTEVKVLNSRNLDERVSDKEDNEQSQSSITFGGEEEKQEGKTGGGKYVCTYCNLACSKPSVLQKHIRAHTNERPYPCVSCGFSFKTRSNLYKHCRSRSHANRVMGHKAREMAGEPDTETPEPSVTPPEVSREEVVQPQAKPYKPRFHTAKFFDENTEINQTHSERISTRINELIDKNNTIVNKTDHYLLKRRPSLVEEIEEVKDEPLNLTNKSRKRCLSEVSEPAVQKSLIKELLLKNYADTNMQCPHCKMIFQTVTELELHKMRNCKGMTKTGARYSRSSSVNVASILTQNKNAFDNIPQVFPLKSPGPFLGKTRLVESDKSKSFSYEDVIQFPTGNDLVKTTQRYSLSPLSVKKPPVKLFGGEVKIAQTTGDSKNFKIDGKERVPEPEYNKTENRVVKSTLQSGGTVLQNKKPEAVRTSPEVIRVYDNAEKKDNVITNGTVSTNENSYNYTNLMDFSQKAARMLAPNLHHQLNVAIPGLSIPAKYPEASSSSPLLTLSSKYPDSPVARMQDLTISSNQKLSPLPQTFPSNITNPMNLVYNGKVVRYVPGIPGPVTPLEPAKPRLIKPDIMITPVSKIEQEVKPEIHSPIAKSPETPPPPPRKFARPNSLALKPSMSSLKQHHGLTPTMFNQILISPDTPRGAKKYNEHFLHGNYFSYLGLKSSTKPVYCTLNKTQPFYVPHFKKLSMYSEWRQQDHKSDKYYASAYDSRQRPPRRFTVAGRYNADYIVHSSYKFTVSEMTPSVKEESQKTSSILGGYESTEEYTYVRGRGRGRYVCEECGIRCKKPSMLKKHIRTHMNIRPYRCDHCNFSFKTKGNLTKHLKSKVHNKNYAASNCSSSGSASPAPHTQSSDSEDDSGDEDSSDESSSTRQQEHEAAYGLLSLSQKPASTSVSGVISSDPSVSPISVNSADGSVAMTTTSFINAEQLAHVSKTSYAKNKILDQPKSNAFNPSILCIAITTTTSTIARDNNQCLGLTNSHRPLMYPYTNLNHSPADPSSAITGERMEVDSPKPVEPAPEKPVERKNIIHFNVIKRYNPQPQNYYNNRNNNEVLDDDMQNLHRKRKHVNMEATNYKLQKNDSSEVMDLSMPQVSEKQAIVNGEVDRPKKFQNKEGPVLVKNYYNHANEEGCTPQTVAYRSGENVQVDKDNNRINVNYIIQESGVSDGNNTNNWIKTIEYDNSAMETLADIATKQEKLEKNSVAKNVATEFLKLATKNEYPNADDKTFMNTSKEINDLVVKSEENKSCTICSKNFSKPSQLRLHMNIHYLERPFKCESCAVSFRTKGHLQKHERSAGHHNKLSSSPALSSSEPRPFKCSDCNIAFRIHGHLAKHLRSKMHIMKLECLAKIPFGLYAELERSNSLLTEINTADGDQCLDSLKLLAKKVFINDPSKLNQLEERLADHPETDTDS